MKAGRPTDYKPATLKMAHEYLDQCEDEEVQQVVGLSAKGTELYKNKLNVNIPSIEGLAKFLGVARSTVYKWAEIHEEFSDMLDAILQEQHQRLLNKGLSGDYNPTITKLILAKHGYTEKTEMTGKDGGPIEQRIIYLPQRDGMETPSRKTD